MKKGADFVPQRNRSAKLGWAVSKRCTLYKRFKPYMTSIVYVYFNETQ